LFYTGTDFTGGITDRMERKFIIDTTAPGVPVLETPANDATITTNAFWFEWSDVTDAVSYEVQFSQNDATDVSGALNVGVWSGDAHHNQPAESRAWSEGATGTWYWQVRSVDAAGNKSAWTAPWKLIIDLSVDNGGDTSGNEEPTETENNGEQNQGTGGESIPPRTTTDDDNQLTTTIPGFAATALPSLIDTTTSPQNEATIDETDASDVLGEQDQRNEGAPLEDTGEVLGLMDQKFFGLVWYWWLVVLAALVGGWLLLAAAIRRGREENL
jgi:hypothetical protein